MSAGPRAVSPAAPRPVPILLVESGHVFGGTERVVDTLARELDRDRFQPWVVIPPSPGLDEWADELRRASVPVERLPEITSRFQWSRALAWFRFLRRRRGALLHAHHVFPSADRYLVPLAHLAGVRAVVVTEHLAARSHSRGQRWLKSWEMSRADRLVAVSRSVAQALASEYGVPAERIEVVPNGVAPPPPVSPSERARLRSAWRVPEDARVWLSVGRLEHQKGIDVLLAAWGLLEEPRPTLVLAGEGSKRAALEAQARALGLADRVRFLGLVREARPLYAAADAFVLSSRQEGMALVLLEAMAAGLPIVATRVEGVAEATGDGEAAALVPPEEPQAIARAVGSLEADRMTARALGERAAARAADRFGVPRMVDAYEALYRRALQFAHESQPWRRADSEAA